MAAAKSSEASPRPLLTTEEQELSAPLGSDIEELLTTLAHASRELDAQKQRAERLLLLVADLSARMYTIEVNSGLRQSGLMTLDGLRFAGNASRATYAAVVQRVLIEFNGSSTPAA